MPIIVADRRGQTDGSAKRFLEQIACDIPIVLMCRTHNFRYNDELDKLDRYLLFEYSEYNWNWDLGKSSTHIWGKNTSDFPQFSDNEHYTRFDEFVAKNQPLITFKREILKKDISETLHCIDYPCWYEVPPPQSKDEYLGREITGMFFWGRSHEARVLLHSEIWRQASARGYSVCDNLYHFEKFFMEERGEKWVSLWQPHYARVDIMLILQMNLLSLMSLALPGAGVKTFRHVESSFNSAMVKYADELAWAFPWVGGENCIETKPNYEVGTVYETLQDKDLLYEIYRNGVENCKRYEIGNYMNQHLLPKINQL